MGFWIAAAVICAGVGLVVVLAAKRGAAQSATSASAYDLDIYRDQLREVERDLARGVLSESEASRTRTEISRRILDADRALQAGGTGAEAPGKAGIGLVAGVFALCLGIAGYTYLTIGAPGYPDLPLEARINAIETAREARPSQALAESDIPERPLPATDPRRAELVAQLRQVLETRDPDPEGLTLLAANEAMLGNFRAAHAAQAQLLDLLGEEATGRHYIDYAEMLIFAAGGYVSPEAEEALRAGLERAPRDGTGRYYAGEMFAQQGRPDRALPIFVELLRESTPDAPWVTPIRQRLPELAFAAGVDLDPTLIDTPRGPTAAEIEAAGQMDPEDQMAMIAGMVEGLAARLSSEGGPPQDWAQLITAYGVLGRLDAAQIVRDEAEQVFAESPQAFAEIDRAFRAAMARAAADQ